MTFTEQMRRAAKALDEARGHLEYQGQAAAYKSLLAMREQLSREHPQSPAHRAIMEVVEVFDAHRGHPEYGDDHGRAEALNHACQLRGSLFSFI